MTQNSNRNILIFLTLIAATIILNVINAASQIAPNVIHSTSTREIQVQASQGWVNTEVLVHPEDVLSIQYVSGSWSPWAGDSYDGIGSGGVPTCDCNVIFGVSHASLIAKVDSGNPFFVGNKFTQPMGQTGYLYLGINDTRLNDNSGSLLVRVNISRSTGQ